MDTLSSLKQQHRDTWSAGDYARVAHGIQPVAEHLVRSAAIRPGERVLDLACGTGNTALAARARGARVTGIDLAPALLAIAARRAVEEGVDDIRWQAADAEQLPFDDASFDVATSSCGVIFAPAPSQVARELARVVRPGGRIAIQAWCGDSGVGGLFALTREHLGSPAPAASPFDWAKPDFVRELLGECFVDFAFESGDCPEFADSPEALATMWIAAYGPTHRAYHGLPPDRAARFRAALEDFFRGYVTPADRRVRWGREYRIVLARRR